MNSYRYTAGVWRVTASGPCSMGTLRTVPRPFIRACERRIRTAVASAPFLVCAGNGEPGGGRGAGLAPAPFPVGGPCALCAQPRWRVRVGAGRLWDRAQQAWGGGGANLTGVRDGVVAVRPALSPSSASPRVEPLFGSPGSFPFGLKLRKERGKYHLFSKGLYSIYVPGPILSALLI